MILKHSTQMNTTDYIFLLKNCRQVVCMKQTEIKTKETWQQEMKWKLKSIVMLKNVMM